MKTTSRHFVRLPSSQVDLSRRPLLPNALRRSGSNTRAPLHLRTRRLWSCSMIHCSLTRHLMLRSAEIVFASERSTSRPPSLWCLDWSLQSRSLAAFPTKKVISFLSFAMSHAIDPGKERWTLGLTLRDSVEDTINVTWWARNVRDPHARWASDSSSFSSVNLHDVIEVAGSRPQQKALDADKWGPATSR